MKRTMLSAASLLLLYLPFPGLAADLPHTGEDHVFVKPSELEWQDVPSMAEGAQMTVIEGELGEAGPFTFRLRLPADYELAPHTHPETERVTVLSGTFHFAHGDEFDREATTALEQGSVAIMPAGQPMFGYTEEETVVQLHGTGPWGIEYINPEDDPRR